MPDPDAPVAPSISVVVTSYNSQDTIGDAVASVLAQTHLPEEIIVVDDGSTDKSLEVLAQFAGRITVVRQDNQGPSAARNAGIAAASGEWIAFLDGDDSWHPEKLALQLVAMDRFSDAAVIASDWTRAPFGTYAHDEPRIERVFASEIAVLNRYQTSTVLARRTVLDAAGGFDSALDSAEDWDLWLRVSKLKPGILIRLPLVFYRDNPQGVSKNLRRLALLAEVIMDREATHEYFSRSFVANLSAWHNQRFIVAALLNRDFEQAKELALRSKSRGSLANHVQAYLIYTQPFLLERLTRRARRLRRRAA